jgi:hypothetical protein
MTTQQIMECLQELTSSHTTMLVSIQYNACLRRYYDSRPLERIVLLLHNEIESYYADKPVSDKIRKGFATIWVPANLESGTINPSFLPIIVKIDFSAGHAYHKYIQCNDASCDTFILHLYTLELMGRFNDAKDILIKAMCEMEDIDFETFKALYL